MGLFQLTEWKNILGRISEMKESVDEKKNGVRDWRLKEVEKKHISEGNKKWFGSRCHCFFRGMSVSLVPKTGLELTIPSLLAVTFTNTLNQVSLDDEILYKYGEVNTVNGTDG